MRIKVPHLTRPSGAASWHGAVWRRRVCLGCTRRPLGRAGEHRAVGQQHSRRRPLPQTCLSPILVDGDAAMPHRLRLLGIFYLAYGALYTAVAALIALLTSFAPDDIPIPIPYLAFLAMGIMGSATFAAGLGLLRRSSWGRPLAILMALLSLLMLPIGTVIGLFGLWALSSTAKPPEQGFADAASA